MKHPELTSRQRRSINRLIRYVRSRRSETSRICKLDITHYESFVSISIETKRTDCDEYSPRMIYSSVYLSAQIGLGGLITISCAESGHVREDAHAAFMLYCSHRTRGGKVVNAWKNRQRFRKQMEKDRKAKAEVVQ